MTEQIKVEYSPLEEDDIIEADVSQLEKRYGVILGKHIRVIRGIMGPITLFFPSKIGLNYPLRGREWEVIYEMAIGPMGEGLAAVRPGANKPLTNEDYAHLYTAWCSGKQMGMPLYILHDGQLYAARCSYGSPENLLFLSKLRPSDG